MEIFNFFDYRSIIRAQLAEHAGERGYQSKLAHIAGCHKTYLSQVLNSHIHLTLDHAAGLSKNWGLSKDETSYFLTLVQLERAATPTLRKILEDTLAELRSNRKDIATRLAKPAMTNPNEQVRYYSRWQNAAIHVLASIPAFQTENAISERLLLSAATVRDIVQSLEVMGLVQKSNGKIAVTQNDIHLPKNSPLTAINHCNWRYKALESIQNSNDPDAIHFSAVYAMSRADISRLRELILESIQRTSALVKPSPEEEVVCFSCDLFTL